MTQVRRVVTGHQNGKSVFVSDEMVVGAAPEGFGGIEQHRLWGADQAPTFPDDGSPIPQEELAFFPPVDGFRFIFFSVPPDDVVAALPEPVDPVAAAAEAERFAPGMLSHMEPDDPGMHTSDTIDFVVVLKGCATLELDDGHKKTMGPGETIVQNGTRHRWSNQGSEPVLLVAFLLGAHRA